MEFVTSKESLHKELQAMQGIVEKKSTIPILANIVIDAKKDRLEMLATDLEVAMRTGCDASVKTPGSVTLSKPCRIRTRVSSRCSTAWITT